MKTLQTKAIKLLTADVDSLRHMVEHPFGDEEVSVLEDVNILEDFKKSSEELESLRAVTPIEIERDHMPRQVAREMLCAPGLSNRMRKNCFDALSTHYVSQLKSKPGEAKLANRFKAAKLTQLEKWLSRVIFRRANTQKQYLKAMKLGDTPMKRALLAALDYKAQLLDLTRECLEDELEKRLTRVELNRMQQLFASRN